MGIGAVRKYAASCTVKTTAAILLIVSRKKGCVFESCEWSWHCSRDACNDCCTRGADTSSYARDLSKRAARHWRGARIAGRTHTATTGWLGSCSVRRKWTRRRVVFESAAHLLVQLDTCVSARGRVNHPRVRSRERKLRFDRCVETAKLIRHGDHHILIHPNIVRSREQVPVVGVTAVVKHSGAEIRRRVRGV